MGEGLRSPPVKLGPSGAHFSITGALHPPAGLCRERYMSPPPQGGVAVPLSTRSETKNSVRPNAASGRSPPHLN